MDSYNTAHFSEEHFAPQPGPQTDFLNTSADIAIYGGAAGGGKTYALLLEPLRHMNNPQFGAVIFRREAVQIMNEGGLFDTSFPIYSALEGQPKLSPSVMWQFPSNATIRFSHLHNEHDVNDWQGAQIPFLGYDELTHFSEEQFWYMLSRNRSMCGVRPYVRATCNPDASSWVANFIAWYIDQETGYPIKEHSGVIRYFLRHDDNFHWAATRQELQSKFPGSRPKSFTFIPATLEDNKLLNIRDPDYRANLAMLGRVERERLLMGNWKIMPQQGSYFPITSVRTINTIPSNVTQWVRRWDLAATEPSETNPDPDATASVLMGKTSDNRFIVADIIHMRSPAHLVRDAIRNIAAQDRSMSRTVTTIIPQDPGQAGKDQAQSLTSFLAGFKVKSIRETGPKETRAEPLSAQWQNGNVDILEGHWNRQYLQEMSNFPSKEHHDDLVDASSGAFLELTNNDFMARWKALAR
jgi:predicted phage terminase large subunit-like protein